MPSQVRSRGPKCAPGRSRRCDRAPLLVDSSNASWFGRYRLGSRIATGGMAKVYLGRRIEEDGSRGPVVAVKRLLPHMISDRRIVQMFLNEARITEQIHHPNVISILELGVEGTEPFIVMELLKGRSFAELRQEAAERGQHVPLGIPPGEARRHGGPAAARAAQGQGTGARPLLPGGSPLPSGQHLRRRAGLP